MHQKAQFHYLINNLHCLQVQYLSYSKLILLTRHGGSPEYCLEDSFEVICKV